MMINAMTGVSFKQQAKFAAESTKKGEVSTPSQDKKPHGETMPIHLGLAFSFFGPSIMKVLEKNKP